MSAAAFILLVLGFIGLAMGAYYFMLCYPVVKQCQDNAEAVSIDSERKYLISATADHNDNSTPSAPSNVPDDTLARPIRENFLPHDFNSAYPTIAPSNQSLEESLCCERQGIPIAGACGEQLNRLEEPDCGTLLVRGPLKVNNMQEIPEGHESQEMVPLIHNDDEDGLIVYKPSVKSKNLEEINSESLHGVIPVSEIYENKDTVSSDTDRMKTQQIYLPNQDSSVDHVREHIVLTMHQPITIPPALHMSTSHPPSHMIVTIAQPLNVPSLMVAPIYDEPPLEQPTNSLQQQLNPIVAISTTPSVVDNISENSNHVTAPNYGWNDAIESEKDKNEDVNEDVIVGKSAEKINQESKQTTSPVIIEEITKIGSLDTTKLVEKVADHLFENENSRKDDNSEETDTSEGEITEYNFETAHLLPSTKTILEGEIGAISEVKIVRYTSKEGEGSCDDADASVNDSTRVHFGDPVDDLNDSKDEKLINSNLVDRQQPQPVKNDFSGPDLTISRQSPDGDSLKSLEGEHASFPLNSNKASPQKCKTSDEGLKQSAV